MQFQTAHAAMMTSALTVQDIHSHYLNSGGFFDELEIDAYLHGLAPLPREERDCVAQAINELIDDLLADGLPHQGPRASYSGSSGGSFRVATSSTTEVPELRWQPLIS
ncbi:hypothetical protein [Arthrobacter sp. B1805]|uniref:hypothetical protein n=1 Tax=Arthrobacter sp. B1805 TaxID=2058892 RepID=UPI000CE45E59|nr:hypothetical protein [Arthrobacter sp. B1805]